MCGRILSSDREFAAFLARVDPAVVAAEAQPVLSPREAVDAWFEDQVAQVQALAAASRPRRRRPQFTPRQLQIAVAALDHQRAPAQKGETR
jgi:membrane-bound lytic murein transglycosylase B